MLGIGSVIDGKYKILSEVGHGGMSVVYLAINERANKTWAVKEVRKDGSNDSEVVKQGLMAETEMLKKLNHPNLPSIIDVIDQDDSFLIVMDFIEGRSLLDLVRRGGPQDPDKVVEWAMQLCDVLSYLHSRQPPIIYRDMKPANIMLEPSGRLKLIDFGTAREYKTASIGDTTLLGTRGYAAPEQFGGLGQSDARTDIYCLGATMYHLLTGCSPTETNYSVLPLHQLNPDFAGTGIEKIVAKCCEPNPADRYQNCAELMYALEHVHDADDERIRKRGLIWGGFVGSAAAALLALAGMIGLRVAAIGRTGPALQNLNIGFYVCLAIALVALVCGVLLFFFGDIRTIFAIRTGRAQRQTMEKLREANARTDVLRDLAEVDYTSGALTGNTAASTPSAQLGPPSAQLGQAPAAAPAQAAEPPSTTVPLPGFAAPAQPAAPAPETVPLEVPAAPLPVPHPVRPLPPGFVFRITQNITVVHSDELL